MLGITIQEKKIVRMISFVKRSFKGRIAILGICACCIYLIYALFQVEILYGSTKSLPEDLTREPEESQDTNRTYYISWYNPPEDMLRWPRAFYCGFKACQFSNCVMSYGKENVTESDAVIFDGRFVESNDYFDKKNGQIWVFSAHEAPSSFMDLGGHWKKGGWVSSFNWTMTYDKSNTDIYLPYGEIRKRPSKVVKDYNEIFKNKNRSALIVHSHCHTRASREGYVKKMLKYLDFDSFGKCGKEWKCGRAYFHDKCFDIINKYYFYLAFENAICDQYYTEKLFRNFNYDSIMVVRGGRNDTKRIFPPGSVISTEDFPSITALADYLKKLSESENLYTEFLERKSQYYSVPFQEVYQRAMCELCERMNKQKKYRKQINNIVDWAFGRKPCQQPTDLNDT